MENKRLTEKFNHDGFEYMTTGLGFNYPYAIDKLGKLEDIEEQLGCPLDVLLKALKDGIYYTYSKWAFGRNKFQKLKICLVYDYGKYRLQPIHKANFLINIKEYKQTWWLKEDRGE